MEDWLQEVTKEGALLLLGQDFNSHDRHKKVCRPMPLTGTT